MTDIQFLERDGKPNLAYVHVPATDAGRGLPLVMFCGGYRSDMQGTKALYLQELCEKRGQGYVRFDYAGHGSSEGAFEDGTIGSWSEDALDILDHIADGSTIVVGSSMGGWMALLLGKKRSGVVQGIVGIAAAPDFSEDIFARLSADQQEALMTEGSVKVPNDYSDEPYNYTKVFYEEAKAHLLLNDVQNVDFPIRLVQGMKDKDVPWETASTIQNNYTGGDVDIIFIDDGDHRLSRPEDLDMIGRELISLSEQVVNG